ncbi:unnamed protein product [Withania somnifera]
MKYSKQMEELFLLCNSCNKDEIEVADILLDLDNLVRDNQSSSLVWGSKRRRSNRSAYLDSSPSSLQASEMETRKVNSPATPLSFSPSQYDEQSKHSSRKTETRKELMDNIKQLSRCRELLRGQVETVRNCYDNQKAYNLKLKAMKEQVTRMLNIQGASVNLGQHYSNHGTEPNRQQPFIMDQVALRSEAFHGFQYPLGQHLYPNGLGPINHMGLGSGSMVLPDLNVTVDETFPMDPSFDIDRMNVERKAQFAEARRRRMIKRTQLKNSPGFTGAQRRR